MLDNRLFIEHRGVLLYNYATAVITSSNCRENAIYTYQQFVQVYEKVSAFPIIPLY